MASPQFPEPPAGIEPTPEQALDTALDRLAANKERWIDLDLSARIRLLEQIKDGTLAEAERWVELTCRSQGPAVDGTNTQQKKMG